MSLLTPRWFKLPAHVKIHTVQNACLASQIQFNMIAAGRRSFKTERILKRHFIRYALSHRNKNIMLGAPTRPQAKAIFWDDIKALTPKYLYDGEANETSLKLRFIGGSQITVVGLQEYQRVEGQPWDLVGITEFQHTDPMLIPQTIQPILNDTNGQGFFEGRPLGKNHFFDYFQMAKTNPRLFAAFTWKSSEVMSEEQIENAKATLGKEDYEREYDASFETGGQRVYYAYTDANNQAREYDPNTPLIITCDFNATEKPMSWTVGQRFGEEVFWRKSLSFKFTNTVTMCQLAEDYIKTLGRWPDTIIFYGDYAGTKNTSNSSLSDWDIIVKHFQNKGEVLKKIKPCLSVRDRNAATNARLCNANNVRRMFVDPTGCKELIKDWEYVQRKENGIDLDGSNPERTHNSDSVDYFSDYEYPIHGKNKGIQYK